MGSTSSKFKKYIQNGDEYAAMQIYQGSPELKKNFDPNLSYGEGRHHNTAMHYAARYGMKHLLRTFLNDLDGDPNKRNAFDETVLHSACSAGTSFPPVNNHISISCVQLTGNAGNSVLSSHSSPPDSSSSGSGVLTASAQERRAACIALLLQWRGIRLPASEEKERIQLDALDRDGNSALHLAAGAGLLSGVRLLLSAGVQTLVKDSRGRTAAEKALANGHPRLAALIEKAMLFSEEPIDWCSERWGWTLAEICEEETEEALANVTIGDGDSHNGLRPQELREAKDRLLVDTSDMLRVSLFTAEALLRDNEWCRDVLVERWMKDATACCQSAGVSLPGGSLDSEHPEEVLAANGEQKTIECGICCEEVSVSEAGSGGCGHVFCAGCWGRYLRGRVCEGEPRPPCPAPRCRRAAPQHLLQRCLTPTTQRKYLLFDIKAFVESSRGMKWCPVAECGKAVKLHETELSVPAVPTASEGSDEECPGGYPSVSRGVDCGDFHFFCWECNGEPHAPLGCSSWSRWATRAGAAPLAPLAAAAGGAESAASSLWLLAHCKPCPSCSCPIQKNDGCNHMKCTKCKFDFCWVCLDSWKRHGSSTGGYFRCTREEAAARAEQTRGNALAEARIQNVEAQEQWRFALQCARYRCHEQRWLAEKPLIIAMPAKSKALDPSNSSLGALETAARELGLCRRMLIGCCAYVFVLPVTAPHRAAFHYAHDELEKCTQRLANLVACEIIEVPLLGLKRAAAAARRWRLAVMRLARPPPPPAHLSGQELRMMARLLARGRLDPRDPWRFPLGPRGEPLKVVDPLDPDQPALQEPQPVAQNPVPEHQLSSNDADVYRINVSEYNMDLIIALEMSRLQMLEEQARRSQESDSSSASYDATLTRNRQRPARLNISVSIGASSDNEDKSLSDDQLKLAIQLSLQEPMGHFRYGDKKNGDFSDKMHGETSTSGINQYRENECGTSWSITKERRDLSQDAYDTDGMPNQDDSWSKAADITVGYFLKALGRTPLELPNLALGLDIGNKNRNTGQKETSNRKDEPVTNIRLVNSELKSRPPLLRSEGAGHRPPLLRQMGGKVRRSWSMGDISIRSSSTDDTTCNKVNGEITQYEACHNDTVDCFYGEISHSSKPEKKVSSKCVQIDVSRCENQISASVAKSILKSSETLSKKDTNDSRKKLSNFPRNLPWGEFCCEKKCVKTYSAETAPTSPRYHEKKEKLKIVLPETEAPKTVSVDCRGKLNQNVFDFSEKTIHLPDLNSSHLKVNSHLTKLAINKHIGLLGEKNCLNQNEILGDSFRRHSDHIPRSNDGQNTVKASSSEKHIGEKSRVLISPEKDSPKKKSDKTPKSDLSIKIIDCPDQAEPNVKTKRGLETDSSNECESETGIPKSPTLYISGVSICREPVAKIAEPIKEQKSPKTRQKVVWKEYKGSNILSSSPVIVRVTSPSLSPCSEGNHPIGTSSEMCSPSRLKSPAPNTPTQTQFSDDIHILDLPVLPPSHFSDDVFYDEDDPALMVDCQDKVGFAETVYAGCHSGGIMISNMSTFGTLKSEYPMTNKSLFNIDYIRSRIKNEEALYENLYPHSDPMMFEMSLPNSPTSSLGSKSGPMQKSWSARTLVKDLEPQTISKLKSRSANEPERDREMFQFPKSSTDGALSSVLHVQESNLSSDDFHEALFLLERSPKTRDSKRRKRSKKREKGGDPDKKSEQKVFEDVGCSCLDKFKTDKEDNNCIVENDSPSIEQDEVSSAL